MRLLSGNWMITFILWCKFYLFNCSSAALELSNSIIHLAINQGKVIRRRQTTELNNNVAMNVDKCKVVIEAISSISIFRVPQNIIYILRWWRTASVYAATMAATLVPRNLSAWGRTQDWWDHVVGTWDQQEWVSCFGMQRETFEMLREQRLF